MSKVIYKHIASQQEAAKRPEPVREEDKREVPASLKRFASNKLYYIRTYGCQANTRDEEIMAGYLEEAGFRRTPNPREADLAIINTCAVRENAEEKIYGEIGSYKSNKEKNPDFLLVLAGCVMGENGVAESLLKTYPWISLVIGTHDISSLNPLLAKVIEEKNSIVNVRSFSSEIIENLPSTRLNAHEAYVNISYGCDKFCTYCIVPYTRGRERSRKPEDIIKECKELVRDGYKQITLLGQNVNSYGLDLKDGTTFAYLLEEVAKTGIPHLRFLTSYPSQFTDEMIEAMAKYPNIDHYLHFPIQSGSSSCLRRMGRRYTREEYLDIVRRIKERIPDIALTTDIIVGFPGETEEEFLDTLSVCDEVGYSSSFTFIYSPRSGTPAAKMEQIPPEISHERFNRLKEKIDELTEKSSALYVGKDDVVLVQGPSKKNKEVLTGYNSHGKLINFLGPSYLTGCEVNVHITENHTYSLFGELVEDPLFAKARNLAYLLSLDPTMSRYLSLDKEIREDKEIKELAEKLVEYKKEMSLSMGDEKAHKEAKDKYDHVVDLISHHPLLVNRDDLKDDVENNLRYVEGKLK